MDDSLSWNPFDQLLAGGLSPQHRLQFAIGRDRLAEAIFGRSPAGENRHWDLIDLRTIKTGIELLCYVNWNRRSVNVLRGLALRGFSVQEPERPFVPKPKMAGTSQKSIRTLSARRLFTPCTICFLQDTIKGYFDVVDALQALAHIRKAEKAARPARRTSSTRTRSTATRIRRVAHNAHIFHALQSYLRGLYDEEELKKRSFSERIEGVRTAWTPSVMPRSGR